MDKERYHQLMWRSESELTPEELAQGWHFCWELDGLLIEPGSGECGSNPRKCLCGMELNK